MDLAYFDAHREIELISRACRYFRRFLEC